MPEIVAIKNITVLGEANDKHPWRKHPFLRVPLEKKRSKVLTPRGDDEPRDNEIDRLVYGLYGLTDEEIKIVEGK